MRSERGVSVIPGLSFRLEPFVIMMTHSLRDEDSFGIRLG